MPGEFVLIISPQDDIHSLAVKRQLDEFADGKAAAVIFDAAAFPTDARILISPYGWQLHTSNNVVLTSENVRSIWWRRPSRHRIDEQVIDAGARKFAENEATHAFDTLVYWRGNYLVVNPVDKELVANRKTIQLAIAAKLGLKVPKTLVTNSASDAVAFADSVDDGAIYKTLTAPISVFGETRRFSKSLGSMTPTISLAPVIFQEEIKKRRDIRVTIIGKSIFASWIEVRNPIGHQFPDWRLDVTAKAHKTELPNDIVTKLWNLMSELGLVYGAVDLIEDVNGEFYFLEVNPSGQFLFNEVDTGEDLALAFARMLLRE